MTILRGFSRDEPGEETVFDFHLNFLEDIVEALDAKLDEIADESDEWLDPDAMGILDRYESVVGLAFGACQTYMAAVLGCYVLPHASSLKDRKAAKGAALRLGPKHAGGRAVADLVDNAANHWKHSEEWVDDGSPNAYRSKIRDAFSTVGIDLDSDAGYPVSGVLYALAPGADKGRFAVVVRALVEWRETVYAASPNAQPRTSRSS